MQSTFHGLETARRAMMTQQSALHTTGHNIANANTPGYTRQRVNFTQTESFPGIGKNSPMIPGQVGTGVKAGSIQRVREHFLDVQYRNENNKVGYYDAKYESLTRMEDILNEPSEQGLASLVDQFWGAMQDLNGDADDAGARAVARRRAEEIADTFQYMHSSLTTVQNDYKAEIDVTVKEVNSLLSQLNDVNKQIRSAEPHGYVTNDLYDEQDRILDQLSSIIDIDTKRETSGGKPSEVAEGAVTVTLKGTGDQLVNGVNSDELKLFNENIVFNTNNGGFENVYLVNKGDEKKPVGGIENTDKQAINFNDMPRGALKALTEAYGYIDDGKLVGTYPDMIANLNEMAKNFATEVNNIHSIGYTLDVVDRPTELGGNFFNVPADDEDITAANIRVDKKIMESLNNIAAAGVNTDALKEDVRIEYLKLINKSPKTEEDYDKLRNILADHDNSYIEDATKAFAGDGSNARLMANMKDTLLEFKSDGNPTTATLTSFYQGIIGEMAVETQEAGRMLGSSEGLRTNVEFNRQSVSNVSLDEEMTMMIQYQHAYNAAARNITSIDEMLDRIINGMGVVGR